MGWTLRRKKRLFVNYWLVVIRTDLINENQETEYYFYQSDDNEPNIFIDADNNNELNKKLWTPIDKETFDKSGSELMRSVAYTPGEGDADQIKVDWIYFFSFREEKANVSVRTPVSCADCEYYSQNNTDSNTDVNSERKIWCDYRKGMYYYCPGYADLKTCLKCGERYEGAVSRCMFHAERDSITGIMKLGDCSQWNRSGDCENFSEAFRDEDV